MNNPLEKLLKWRLDNIIEQFDIEMDNFNWGVSYKVRKNAWKILNQKLVLSGYITLQDSELHGCYYVIKNIIWKNIINYELRDNTCYMHMLWNKYKKTYAIHTKKQILLRATILNIDTDNKIESKKNLKRLHSTMIHYLLLLNEIILHNLIHDLTNILNMYIFDVILVI